MAYWSRIFKIQLYCLRFFFLSVLVIWCFYPKLYKQWSNNAALLCSSTMFFNNHCNYTAKIVPLDFFFFFWITKGYLLCCRIRLRVSLLMFDFGNLFVFGFSILVLSLVYYQVVCTSSMLPPAVFIPPPPSGVFGLNMPLSVRPSAHPPVHLCVLPLNICRIYMKLSL